MVGLINKEDIYDIADAIREKTQTEDTFKPSEMGDLIRSIRVIPENSYQLKELTVPTSLATFDADALPMPSLKVGIEPQQDLHGYDHPWVGGAGKNKLQVTATSQTINGVTFTVNDDGTIKVNGTATADARFVIGEYILKAGSSVRLNGSPVDGSNSTIALGYQGYGIVSTANSDRVCDRTSASTDWDNDVYINVTSGYTANNLTFKPMIRLASVADATFAPYSNICPISGWDECKVTVADDLENPTVSNVYTIDLDGTRYGGKLDVVNGVLTVEKAEVDLGDLTWTAQTDSQGTYFRSDKPNGMKFVPQGAIPNALCSIYAITTSVNVYDGSIAFSVGSEGYIFVRDTRFTDATAFKTAMNGVQLVYELATPLTIQLTPTQVKSLLGTNNVRADTGNILEGEYFKAL